MNRKEEEGQEMPLHSIHDELDQSTEEKARRLKGRFSEMEMLVPSRPPLKSILPDPSTDRPGRRLVRSPIGALAGVALAAFLVATGLLIREGSVFPQTPSAPQVFSSAASVVLGTSFGLLAKGHLLSATWSPDGSHVDVAVQSLETVPATPTSQNIFDKAGSKITTLTADWLRWTSPSAYVVGRTDSAGTVHESAGQLGSSAETAVPSGSAIVEPMGSLSCVASSVGLDFTVWIGGKESASMPGIPRACSSDGTEVAVLQVTQEGVPNAGWIRVVDTRTGKVTRDLPAAQSYDRAWASFSPNGLALAFANSADAICIANLSTGQTQQVLAGGYQGPITPAWLPDGRLAVPDPQTRKVRAFGVSGTESAVSLPFAPNLFVSSAGVAFAFDRSSTTLFTQSSDGTAATLNVGASPYMVSWSPDGREAVVICADLTPTNGYYDETAALVVSH